MIALMTTFPEPTSQPSGLFQRITLSFFGSLREVNQVSVLGHSLSNVDLPYFDEIVQNIRPSCPDWTISYYNETDIHGMKCALVKVGVPAEKIKYVRLADVRL